MIYTITETETVTRYYQVEATDAIDARRVFREERGTDSVKFVEGLFRQESEASAPFTLLPAHDPPCARCRVAQLMGWGQRCEKCTKEEREPAPPGTDSPAPVL